MPATLFISRDAVTSNYAALCREAQGAEVGAVLKANAYGIGIEWAAPLLWEAGARAFFVANAKEGLLLRQLLPHAQLIIFHGIGAQQPAFLKSYNLLPVLNTPEEAQKWGSIDPCWIQVDIGMKRLGFSMDELSLLPPLNITGIMAQLSTSEVPKSPHNQEQKLRFEEALSFLKIRYPHAVISLANSGGLFLGTDFTHQLIRSGVALWGIGEIPGPEEHPDKTHFRHALTLKAPVLQVRSIQEPTRIGYHQMGQIQAGEKIVTVEIGYGDGLLRSASQHAYLTFENLKLPICGRISMDAVMVKAPEHCQIQAGEEVIVWGGNGPSAAHFAQLCGTHTYELLCILTSRIERRIV